MGTVENRNDRWIDATTAVAHDIVAHANSGISGQSWEMESGQLSWLVAGVAGLVPNLEFNNMALMVDHHGGQFRVSLWKKQEFDRDVVGMMMDRKARNRMLMSWYRQMAGGYGNSERRAFEGAHAAFVEGATALGVNPLAEYESLNIFSNSGEEHDIGDILQGIGAVAEAAENYSQAFSGGEPSHQSIMVMMEGLWELMGRMDGSLQQQLMHINPDKVKSNVPGEHGFEWDM